MILQTCSLLSSREKSRANEIWRTPLNTFEVLTENAHANVGQLEDIVICDNEAFVREDLTSILALEKDRVALNGTGSSGEPRQGGHSGLRVQSKFKRVLFRVSATLTCPLLIWFWGYSRCMVGSRIMCFGTPGLSIESVEGYLSSRRASAEQSTIQDGVAIGKSVHSAVERAEAEARARQHTYLGTGASVAWHPS